MKIENKILYKKKKILPPLTQLLVVIKASAFSGKRLCLNFVRIRPPKLKADSEATMVIIMDNMSLAMHAKAEYRCSFACHH